MEYTIWSRINDDGQEITKAEAEAIIQGADMHSGPYGCMGGHIDQVLYYGETIMAVRYRGQWLDIPEHQVVFMESEISRNHYEEV